MISCPPQHGHGCAVGIPEEAVVADAVLTSWENMDQEPADERVRSVGHGFVPTGAVDAVVLDAKGAPRYSPYF